MLILAPLLMSAHTAFAADVTKNVGKDTLDIGVLKDSEVKVVQKMLYRKEGALELGAHLGVMPFDAYTVTPLAAVTGTMHFSDTMAAELQVGGGYGLSSATWEKLNSATYGVAVESYRYLASAEVDIQYTPIYGKMNFGGKKVVHDDVYVLAGAGLTVESSMLPAGDLALAPTIPVGVGIRVFATKKSLLRFELRDNVMIEHHAQSDEWEPKQNAVLSVGLSLLSGGKQ